MLTIKDWFTGNDHDYSMSDVADGGRIFLT